MNPRSSTDSYGSVAVMIHWTSALLIVALLGSGFTAANTIDPGAKAQILRVHAPLGIAILILTLGRIAWWRLVDKRPNTNPGVPKWQRVSARSVHLLFYIVIIGMAASGIGMFVLSGAGSILFAGAPGQLPDFQSYPPRVPHGFGARFMVLLFLIHAGAALYHHLVLKDGLISRMWFHRGDKG